MISSIESIFLKNAQRFHTRFVRYRNLSSSGQALCSNDLLQATQARSTAIIDRYNKRDHLDYDVWKKRLIYRSKQRGWLEVDLLLGTYAGENVPLMSPDELEQFEDFINLETIDIYNIITLRTDIPDELKSQLSGEPSMAEKIQKWASSMPLGTADPDKYKQVKLQNNLI